MLLMLLACSNTGPVVLGDAVDTGAAVVDLDGDGYGAEVDCHDADPSINPGADEVCDGLDNNCSGAVDDNPVDAVRY